MSGQPGLLTRNLGADALAVFIGGVQLSLDDVGPVTIHHGRRDVDEQPGPASCSLAIHATALPALPEIGDYLAVDLGDDAAAAFGLTGTELELARHRFQGTVTDVTYRPAGPHTPAVVALVAVSLRARLGRTQLTGSWPQENDGQRAERILTAAAAETGLTVGLIDPGTVAVAAREVANAPALGLLDQLASDSGSVLAETRDGLLGWHDAEHRRGATPIVDLDADQVLTATTPTQKLSGLVNDLTVTYADGATRLVDADSADPITGYGPFRSAVSTELAEQADAESLAILTLGRRARPWWDIGDGLTVELLRSVDRETAAALLTLEFADLIRVTNFPASGPFQLRLLWVEGWTETITRHSWLTELAVSDLELTGPAARWVDVRPEAITWAEFDADMRWLDAIGYRPVYGTGLWVDLAARDRWATHTPDNTWAEA